MANAISSVLDKQIFQDKKINSVIRLPLQEQDLLTLHEKFVTVGFHEINVRNFHEGKVIVETILHSLKYYKHAACISLKIKESSSYFHAVCYEQEFHDETVFSQKLIDFFEKNDSIDFLCIEYAHNKKAFSVIKNVVDQYHMSVQIPIIIMTYCQ